MEFKASCLQDNFTHRKLVVRQFAEMCNTQLGLNNRCDFQKFAKTS